MKIQFCYDYTVIGRRENDVIAEFDVAEEPTEEQCKAIEDEIFEAIDKWDEENDGDFSEFDYWGVCYEAARKHLKIVENRVVRTFYV